LSVTKGNMSKYFYHGARKGWEVFFPHFTPPSHIGWKEKDSSYTGNYKNKV
jgi:hypothetical protein